MFPIMVGLAIPVALVHVAAAVLKTIQQSREGWSTPCPPPMPPTKIDPRWRTSDVLGLARGIIVDHAFDRLPILGDALMDAGCEDEAILRHCRTQGQGDSWLVGLLLGVE